MKPNGVVVSLVLLNVVVAILMVYIVYPCVATAIGLVVTLFLAGITCLVYGLLCAEGDM